MRTLLAAIAAGNWLPAPVAGHSRRRRKTEAATTKPCRCGRGQQAMRLRYFVAVPLEPVEPGREGTSVNENGA